MRSSEITFSELVAGTYQRHLKNKRSQLVFKIIMATTSTANKKTYQKRFYDVGNLLSATKTAS